MCLMPDLVDDLIETFYHDAAEELNTDEEEESELFDLYYRSNSGSTTPMSDNYDSEDEAGRGTEAGSKRLRSSTISSTLTVTSSDVSKSGQMFSPDQEERKMSQSPVESDGIGYDPEEDQAGVDQSAENGMT